MLISKNVNDYFCFVIKICEKYTDPYNVQGAFKKFVA